jgi:hypothetical protein
MENFKKKIYKNVLKGKGKTDEEISIVLLYSKFICPHCLKEYAPKHKSKEKAFETNDLESREQWLSHICSTKCWNEFLGVE